MSHSVQVKTAGKTVRILEAIHEIAGGTLGEISEAMAMPESTTHDYLQTLSQLGYVVEDDGEYVLSTKFLELGEKRRRRMKIYRSARPEIERLAKETGEHASLLIEENGAGVLLDYEAGNDALQLDLVVGERYPLPVTAPGKAILAHLSAERTASILDEQEIPAATQNTITDRDRLYRELEDIREKKYAVDDEEHIQGVRAVSTPIICRNTVVGAITIGGPVRRLTDERITDELPTKLRESANIIEVNYIHS